MDTIMNQAERALQEKRPGRVKNLLNEGKKLTKERQNILCLADRDRWEVAFAYMTDDIADNEENQKLMRKAKKAVAEGDKKHNSRHQQRPPRSAYANRSYETSTNRAGNSSRRHNREPECYKYRRMGHYANKCTTYWSRQ